MKVDRTLLTILSLGLLISCLSQGDASPTLKGIPRFDLKNRLINGFNSGQVGNVIDGATQAYHVVEKTVKWFKRLKQEVKQHTPVSLRYNNSELTTMEYEIYTCAPVDEDEQCFSPCVFTEDSVYYRVCYVDSKGYSYKSCTCKIRPSILRFLIMKRREMMGLVPQKQLNGLEITLIVFLALLVAILIGATVRKFCMKRNQLANPPLVADMLPPA